MLPTFVYLLLSVSLFSDLPCDCGVIGRFTNLRELLVWMMAQRLVRPSSVPQTHDVQMEQDERESARLFLNSVGRLAEGDADLSQEESATLLR